MDLRIHQLESRAAFYSSRFLQEGGTTKRDIEKAIALAREALELCPPGHNLRSSTLYWLSIYLLTCYDNLSQIQHLEEAIVVAREALELSSHGHSDRLMRLSNLADSLSDRYKELGRKRDIEEAIALAREALQLCTRGHPNRSRCLSKLGDHLFLRYKELGEIQDLDKAIVLGREEVKLLQYDHSGRAKSLINLGLHLAARYERLGRIQDLDEATDLSRQALELHPQGHPHRWTSLHNFSADLYNRYEALGRIQDLDEAVSHGREALELSQLGHHDRPASLNNLMRSLYARSEELSRLEDLHEAVVLAREAVELCPAGHPDRWKYLDALGTYLTTRFHKIAGMQDLDDAVLLAREALELHPQGHPKRATCLSNLGIHLMTRFESFGEMEDLDEAIVLGQEALELRPQGHPDRSVSLNNLGIHLCNRYEELGAIQDIDEAIVLMREALELRPHGSPDRSAALSNLGSFLSKRYEKYGGKHDLDEAITVSREALKLSKSGHFHSKCLRNLANYLSTRCSYFYGMADLGTSLHDPSTSLAVSDRDEVFSIYAQLLTSLDMVSRDDLGASLEWISAAEKFKHSSILVAYETALWSLNQYLSLFPSSPEHLAILKLYAPSLAVDAFSACLRHHSPKRAVELLEQGRGVFWKQLVRLSSPLDNVIASGSAGETLAKEFARITSLIKEALRSSGGDQHDKICGLNLELRKVVNSIQELPCLSRFLKPSIFSELQRAASGGPVIIVNGSQYGCDVLVLLDNQDPVHIPLSITKDRVQLLSSKLGALTESENEKDVTNDLSQILRELWHDVVLPVVQVLQTGHPLQSRIWWCPTAEFCELPLHAAGPYTEGQQNLADLYISSYTTTLSALIRTRRTHNSQSANGTKRFIAICQSNEVGESNLSSVSSELAKIGQVIGGAATFKQIEGEEASISRVVEELWKNKWVHIACDALANTTEPFESSFALHGGPFTIEQIIRHEVGDAEFAYLSAPHTVVGDGKSPDEGIHLASAMQFIGFRSVIGMMWEVEDEKTKGVASRFYQHMLDESGRLDYTRAAFALNETLKSVDAVDQRALYVHFGA